MVLSSASEVLLHVAEKKQLINQIGRCRWLDDLKSAIYNAEDLIYDVNTKAVALRFKLETGCLCCKLRNFFSSTFLVVDIGTRNY